MRRLRGSMRHSMWPSTCTSHRLCFNNRHTVELRGLLKAEHWRTQPCHDPAMSLSLFKLPRVSSHERENNRREAQRQQQPKRGFPSCCARPARISSAVPSHTNQNQSQNQCCPQTSRIMLPLGTCIGQHLKTAIYVVYYGIDIFFTAKPIPSPCDDRRRST
jgi:hypothetical protein